MSKKTDAQPGFAVGNRVAFRPGTARVAVAGKIVKITPGAGGRGGSTFLTVECDDGKTRKCRPGSAELVA